MLKFRFTLISLGCALALTASVLAGTAVYKWVDENGVVHYSDQPHPNAQKLQVQGAQTYRSSESAVGAPSGPQAPPQANAPARAPYQGCVVAQPLDDQTYTNVDSLNIVVRTDPVLHPGDQVYLLMDGLALNNGAATGAQYTLSPVERGTHTLQALIRDRDGVTQCQTPGVTFSVHQPSVLGPQNPQHH